MFLRKADLFAASADSDWHLKHLIIRKAELSYESLQCPDCVALSYWLYETSRVSQADNVLRLELDWD